MADRTILHCDCNSFYASVECVHRPELREVPMAVCGNPESRHGIILAKNELAKRYGVQTAETVGQAKRKCPDLIFVAPHREEYERFSQRINAIYQQYTDRVEPFSIDESWLDLTGCEHLFGDGKTVADELRRRVREEVGVTISVGVSFNKVFAKLGSDYKKPDATTVISRENFREKIWPLPVNEMMYVGNAAKTVFNRMGVHTIGQLALLGEETLRKIMGKMGEMLYIYANGLDESPVRASEEACEIKSVGNGMTFPRDLYREEDIHACVMALADSVATRLRRHGLRGYTVQVLLRDPDFRNISRQKTLEHSTCTAQEITEEAMKLIALIHSAGMPIRMITITVANLTDEDYGDQLNFFAPNKPQIRRKQERAERAMDAIRAKFGKEAVQFGATFRNENLSFQKQEMEKREQ